MKKFYALFLSLGLFTALNAQVTVQFQVDMTDYLANGGTLETIKIAGNFSALTGGAVPDWSPPASPVFEDLGNNVWSCAISFVDAGSVLFKFLNTADSWGDCNIVQECMAEDAGACILADGGGNVNRTLEIPTEDAVLCYKWETCDACTGTSTEDLQNGRFVKVAPNPLKEGVATVTFANLTGEAHQITLSNIAGQMLREFNNVRGNFVEIEKGQLLPGMYFVTVSSASGVIASSKLVVE